MEIALNNPMYLCTSDGSNIGIATIDEIEYRYGECPTLRGHILDQFNPFRKLSHQTIIKKVIFNAPATIVYWTDGTKTVVKCQPGDTYSEELGLAMAISKKYLGNKGNFNDEFKKWLPEKTEATDPHDISVSTKRQKLEKYCEFNMCQRCALEDEDFQDCDFDEMSDDEICRLYDKVFRQKN